MPWSLPYIGRKVWGGRGVTHCENSQSSGNSTRNKVAIPAMVTAGGVNHCENSQSAGNCTRNKVAISAMVTAGGGGSTIVRIANLREIC